MILALVAVIFTGFSIGYALGFVIGEERGEQLWSEKLEQCTTILEETVKQAIGEIKHDFTERIGTS